MFIRIVCARNARQEWSGYNWVCSHQSPFVSFPPLLALPSPPTSLSRGLNLSSAPLHTTHSTEYTVHSTHCYTLLLSTHSTHSTHNVTPLQTWGNILSQRWRGSEEHQGEISDPHMRGFGVRGLGGAKQTMSNQHHQIRRFGLR